MKTLGYYNGVIDELDRMQVPMLDRACYFGDGVYDVSFSRNHKIYALEEHVSRFFQSAARLRMQPRMTEEELCTLLCELVQRLEDGELWVYFQLSRGTGFRTHAFLEKEESNLWIMIRPMPIKDTYKPMRCISMEDTRFYHCNIKSLNLLPNVLATQATVEAGVGECILHRGETVTGQTRNSTRSEGLRSSPQEFTSYSVFSALRYTLSSARIPTYRLPSAA